MRPQGFTSTTERISGQVSMRNVFNRFKQEDWGHAQRTERAVGGDKNYKSSYFLIQESSSRSILFWTSTVGKSPTSATTFSLQLEIASKDSLSVVENTSTQAWAPVRSQKETVSRSSEQLCRLQQLPPTQMDFLQTKTGPPLQQSAQTPAELLIKKHRLL